VLNVTGAKAEPTDFKLDETHWAALRKEGAAHKYTHGHAAVISGPKGQGGAARLAARGALRIGAGVVSVICDTDAAPEHTAHLNAVMVKPYADVEGFTEHLAAVKPKAVCIGPNLGLETCGRSVLSQTLKMNIPLCIDADAITLLARPSLELPPVSNAHSVMTPHEGELRRFIPALFEKTSCRISLAQAAAKKAGCVVLFKGPQTVIAAPDSPPMIVSARPFRHTAWLATAGSGDVLAGFVTGLLARGFDGSEAACIAAELHFRCAEAFGPGLVAEDIPEMLPKVFASAGI
jgi:hydroxyethylthiazole kinase-like uncharacterized protein yjeF